MNIFRGKTQFELNKFADMTSEEFRSKVLMKSQMIKSVKASPNK